MLSISNPKLLVGMLLGGSVPMLFSSMTIRAVGRAAYLIVNECRIQFRDKEIWADTKKPDYARVVRICTESAQKELVGPALLAVFGVILLLDRLPLVTARLQDALRAVGLARLVNIG